MSQHSPLPADVSARVEQHDAAFRAGHYPPMDLELASRVARAAERGEVVRDEHGRPISLGVALATLQLTREERVELGERWREQHVRATQAEAQEMGRAALATGDPAWKDRFRRWALTLTRHALAGANAAAGRERIAFTARPAPRPRGAGRPAPRRRTTRPSAASGDSGDDAPAAASPVALCACGCMEPAPIATRTDRRYGAIAGQPRRYIAGHNPGSREHSGGARTATPWAGLDGRDAYVQAVAGWRPFRPATPRNDDGRTGDPAAVSERTTPRREEARA